MYEKKEMSDFLKLAYKNGRVKDVKEAFNEVDVEDEWHNGEINNLHKDSIVKTDILYKILDEQIEFKIGSVDKERVEEYKTSFINNL